MFYIYESDTFIPNRAKKTENGRKRKNETKEEEQISQMKRRKTEETFTAGGTARIELICNKLMYKMGRTGKISHQIGRKDWQFVSISNTFEFK